MKIPENWLYRSYESGNCFQVALFTIDGFPVEIINRGKFNSADGPDYLDALVAIDGIRYAGDVEFHRSPEEWFLHGHQDNRRYDRVILHMVWEAPRGIPPLLQKRCRHIVLAGQLAIEKNSWLAAMRQAPANPLPPSLVGSLSQLTAGELAGRAIQRFHRKVAAIKQWSAGQSLEKVAWVLLAEGLGLRHNAGALRGLIRQLPVERPRELLGRCQLARLPADAAAVSGLWAYLLFLGGLLDNRSRGNHFRSANRPLIAYWQHLRYTGEYPLLRHSDWQFGGVRPANHPFVRLATWCLLYMKHHRRGIFEQILAVAMERLPVGAFLERQRSVFDIEAPPGLAEWVQSCGCFRRRPRLNIGRERLRQLVVNSVLPILYLWARRSDNDGFADYLLSIYEAMPVCESAALFERICRQPQLPKPCAALLKSSGFYQQGFLEWRAGLLPAGAVRCSKSKNELIHK